MINRRHLLAGAGLIGGVAVTSAAVWPFRLEIALKPLIIAGATRMLPAMRSLAKAFTQVHSDVAIECEGGGFYPALVALRRGSIDIAVLARDLSGRDDLKGVRSFLIARDALAIVVNPANPIRTLSRSQVVAVMEGQVRNWKELGGRDAPIRVVHRSDAASDDRSDFEEVVLGHRGDVRASVQVDDDRSMIAAVAADPFAIGYCGVEDVSDAVRSLLVGSVPLERSTMLSGRYPYSWPLNLVVCEPSGEPELAFIDFARSAAGQDLLNISGMMRAY